MVKCPKCGTENKEAVFCKKCGKKLIVPPKIKPAKSSKKGIMAVVLLCGLSFLGLILFVSYAFDLFIFAPGSEASADLSVTQEIGLTYSLLNFTVRVDNPMDEAIEIYSVKLKITGIFLDDWRDLTEFAPDELETTSISSGEIQKVVDRWSFPLTGEFQYWTGILKFGVVVYTSEGVLTDMAEVEIE